MTAWGLDSQSATVVGRDVLSVLCFRAAPMAGWGVLAPRSSVGARAAAGLACGVLIIAAVGWNLLSIPWLLGGYAYFAAWGCCVPRLAGLVRRGRVTRGGVFALGTTAFFLLPGLVVPRAQVVLVLVLGWDLMLSGYSCSVETSKSASPPTIEDVLFFLLVNPALVYVQRGVRIGPATWDWSGVGRIARGLGAISIAAWFFGPVHTSVQRVLGLSSRTSAWAGWGALGSLDFFALYLQHSGLASLQIGMIRQLGYSIPERYDAPLSAASPLEFWRRWNTYVAGWLQRYVFWPASLRWARGTRRGWLARGGGVLAAFGAAGLLHDLPRFMQTFTFAPRSIVAFLLCGAVVLAWAGAAQLVEGGMSASPRTPWRWVTRPVFWLTLLPVYVWWSK